MRHFNGVYTQQFNRRHALVGPLFQGRFKAILMDRDAYLMGLCRYVERNPVAAGLVATADEWAWSSDRAHVCMAPDAVLARFRWAARLSVAPLRGEWPRPRACGAVVRRTGDGRRRRRSVVVANRSASAGLPWRLRFRRSHAGAGVQRAAQRGLCSEGAAQVAQHVAGLPATNSGSAPRRCASHTESAASR